MSHAVSAPVTSVRVHNAHGVKLVRHDMTVSDRAFLPESMRGLGVTFGHLFSNLLRLATCHSIETVSYPEQKRPYPLRFRGMHRLLRRDDGTPRCVACFMCSTACPAKCITIVATERTGSTEKRPLKFEIDEMLCVDCGLCVEACPCDAIRMDTGIHPAPTLTREEAVFDLPRLLAMSGQPDGEIPRTARTLESLQGADREQS
ncbi:MAG: NADH-quinone oxidoreductase subunit I [Pseudomonadota bacterium]